ncbi:SDR family NAD(P)-dependent oxidoreductase [Salinicola rhizosphaerae]|uniref:Short-chain dehydrogenase/reductase family oxidoreductase n=1 Tax=Salinicola rhizosphaerae TaxID=1443141 RepID=A0ABQ3ECJ6_9GAMM|nr:SDR family NAD(P)-dependent oxidoreductase [Salinicola rhizosphaerae]GHB33268.1 short-chain dehydrogenase/reductase family oxidoreductase [Salinicola rhizosphaerae]
MLGQLPDSFTATVTGAGGGIGRAMLEHLLKSERPGRVIAVSRRHFDHDDARCETLRADLTTESGRTALASAVGGEPIHLLFNAIGMLHDSQRNIGPEKRLEHLDPEALATLFHVNAVTPILVIKALHRSLKGSHPVIAASLSARVGSIADNGFGGWYGYRASKAAHNQLMRTAAIELKRENRRAIVLCLHPGTTDTALSKPFQARVPEGKLFTPDFVAARLTDVMSKRRPEESGSFWDWAGKPVPW